MPVEPSSGGTQRRRSVRTYKVTATGGTADREASQDRQALAHELAALVGADDIEIVLTSDESTGQTTVVLIDRHSGRVVAEVTPQELLKAAFTVQHPQGLFVNRRQ